MASTPMPLRFMACIMVFMFSRSLNQSAVDAVIGGVRVELVHLRSPLSPFYNSSDTHLNRMRNVVLHSMYRTNHFHLSSLQPNGIQSDVIPDFYTYLMKFSIGTPPVEVLVVADTGSDLIWTQCDPCKQCYPQDAPIFNSHKSSTYTELSACSKSCQVLSKHKCQFPNSACEYYYPYMDNSFSSGVIATETLTFDSSNGEVVPIPNVVFGCGQKNNITYRSTTAGFVGLGAGPLSLVSQLTSQFGGKFSYCLVPILENVTNKLHFGKEATISGEGIVSTPLIPKDPTTFYYLTLEGISVGNKRLNMQSVAVNSNVGNIIIDSGTTLTYLPAGLYKKMESVLKEVILAKPETDPYGLFPLCYNINKDLKMPNMTFHFTGADLKLGPSNTFVDETEDLVCLNMLPTDKLPIFGNLNQVNFQVEYDLEGKKVSFAPADCTKF